MPDQPRTGDETRDDVGLHPVAVWLALLVAAGAYAALRFAMNREFEGATWNDLLAMRAPLPYGHRILVPWLSRPLVKAGLSVRDAFTVFEWLATMGLVIAVQRAVRSFVPARASVVIAAGVLLVLPLPYLLQHRWAIFYPWDTPGMLVIALGVYLAAHDRPKWALLLTALGALNRETAIVVPAVFAVMRWADATNRRRTLAWCGLMVVAFVVVREGIAFALPNNPGESVRWVLDGKWRVLSNLGWLSDIRHAFGFLGGLALLPLLWALVWRHVPATLRRLHVLVLALLGGLLLVANAYEPRAFGAVIILSYLAAAVGTWHYATGTPAPVPTADDRWTHIFDRFAALAVLLTWGAVVLALASVSVPGTAN